MINLAEQTRLWGLTPEDWATILVALGTFLAAVIQSWRASKGQRKVRAVVEAVEEAADQHPEAVRLVKRLTRDRALKLGAELGLFGLSRDVEKVTKRKEDK